MKNNLHTKNSAVVIPSISNTTGDIPLLWQPIHAGSLQFQLFDNHFLFTYILWFVVHLKSPQCNQTLYK